MPLSSHAMWDAALVAFMEDHFRRGDHPHVGRAALHAIAWALDLSTRNPKVFPLSRLTLAGWTKADPERAKDPAPLEAVLVLVGYWLRTGVRENILSAAASLIAFDCYFRPGALLLLQRRSVTPPSKPPYKHWVLADGATGTGRSSKTNVFDESVLVGFNKRTWAFDIVKTLYNKLHKPSDALFLGLTLAQWERAYTATAFASASSKPSRSPRTRTATEAPLWTSTRTRSLSRVRAPVAAGRPLRAAVATPSSPPFCARRAC